MTSQPPKNPERIPGRQARQQAREQEAAAAQPSETRQNVLVRVATVFGPTSLLLAFVALVALAAAGVTYLISPDALKTSAVILAVIGALFTILFVISAYTQIRATVTGRQGRYSANTFVMIGAFIGIMIFVNFLGGSNNARYDATANKQLSLAPQTIK